MRSFKHWSLKYIFNRVKEIAYRFSHPGYPWLTSEANKILSLRLKKDFAGLEFGSGRSTLWLAKRVKSLISVEHDESWYKKVTASLRKNNILNVKYRLSKKEEEEEAGEHSDYVGIVEECSNNSLDFVLIDGIYRSASAIRSLPKIRAGGMLIIDNANWFLPSNSISPNSRSINEGPSTSGWADLLTFVRNWQCIWTSSGVTDTAFFIKPSPG